MGPLAFTLGEPEAIGGLGHWGGVVCLSQISLVALFRIDLGHGQEVGSGGR